MSAARAGISLERLLELRQALLDAGHTLEPDQAPLEMLLSRLREERPEVVGVVFLARASRLRCMVVVDRERVQLRCSYRVRATADGCQAWNRKHLYTKATVDTDGDLSLQYDYPLVGGELPKEQLQEVVRIFGLSAAAALVYFRDHGDPLPSRLLRAAGWGLAAWGLFSLVRTATHLL